MVGPLSFAGRAVDGASERLGQLVDAGPLIDDASALRRAYRDDGYVFLRGLLDPALVLAAREELLLKYAILGEVDDRHPIADGIAGDGSGVATANLRAFTASLRSGSRYEAVILAPELLDAVSTLLEGPVQPYDFRWPRLARPGEGCGLHCDGPYMSRGTDRHLSVWIPLGNIAPHEGALVVLEGSHTSEDLATGYLTKDADRDGLVWLDDDLAAVQERYGRRWLTAHFEPGDVLIFGMNMLHGAFDNRSETDRCRLSTDSRYLVRGEVPDPRWNGTNLAPHGPGRVFYPGLGTWGNKDFQDEWKFVDDQGRLCVR